MSSWLWILFFEVLLYFCKVFTKQFTSSRLSCDSPQWIFRNSCLLINIVQIKAGLTQLFFVTFFSWLKSHMVLLFWDFVVITGLWLSAKALLAIGFESPYKTVKHIQYISQQQICSWIMYFPLQVLNFLAETACETIGSVSKSLQKSNQATTV